MHVRSLGLLVAIAAALMAFAGTASASSVTTTFGGGAATPTIHAVNEGGKHLVLSNSIANIECQSTTEGTVTSHGAGVGAKGPFSSLSFTGCTNSWHVTVTKLGFFEIRWTSGSAGVYWSSGWSITGTRLGVTCNYETNNTQLGTFTGGNPATVDLSGSIPIAAGSSALCGSGNAKLSGSYVTTSPLYVAP